MTYRTDEEVAARALAELSGLGLPAEARRLDVSAADAAKELAEHPLIARADRLSVVHNAAAAFTPAPLHLLGWEQFEQQLGVGLRGLVALTRATLPRMARTGGGVFAVVSTRAVLDEPPKGFAAYVAAKQAMRSLVKSLAAEHHARGIRAFNVCPGFMPTALTADWDPALRAAAERSAVTGIEAGGAEIARLVMAAAAAEIPGRGEDYSI